ncbi:MAG TPA: hypothetical protein VIU15_23800 [Streptomyces sp.]
MPETGGDGAFEPPRTLAEKLTWLRASLAPEGEKAPSWKTLAQQINQQTGVSVSHTYLWELSTGKRDTNVTLRHIKAFAAFFGRRISYFVDDTVAFEDDVQAQVALLEQLRRLGVHQIRLQNIDGNAGSDTVIDLLGRLQSIDALGDPGIRAVALKLNSLTPGQLEALRNLTDEPSLLDTLPRAVPLLVASADATGEQIDAATRALTQESVLYVLQDEESLMIAQHCAKLLPSSRQAILSMIEQLERLQSDRE